MRLGALFAGDGLRGRSIRSAALTVMDFGSQNALRLIGNLILTRILFPEAFGIMALITVVMTGLRMFSDMGMHLSIIQNKRGTDPVFLDTAWTLQIARGLLLFSVTWALAAPVAAFYEAPILAEALPVAGLMAVFQGLSSTKMAVATRELRLGRVTFINVGARLLGLAVLVGLALWWQSVWALVVGGLVAPFLVMILSHIALPGHSNRVRFDREAAGELIRFGKYIFLSTMAGFLISQGDRAILGKFATLSELAFYNIAAMLATLPRLLQELLFRKVLFPLYSKRAPAESRKNYRDIARVRFFFVAGATTAAGLLAVGGNALITLLYDTRYEMAGPLLVLMAIAIMPALIVGGYGNMIVARGNSARFAGLLTASALLRTTVFLIAIYNFGIVGAALAPLVAVLLFYPALLWFIAPYKGWIPAQDIGFSIFALAIAALAVWTNQDVLRPLFAGLLTQ